MSPLSTTDRDRSELMEALSRTYGADREGQGLGSRRLRARQKRMSWHLSRRMSDGFKRGLDLLVTLGLGVLLSPIIVGVAVIIKLNDGGPVLFWQRRVGRYGAEFWFPKFRSMTVDAEKRKAALLAESDHDDSITFKMKRDPRVTWIGRLIRKTSIDELPQLWCVLKGEMTLVGPRPPVPEEVRRYCLKARRRLEVTPGLTCLWQISGRAELDFDQQLDLDVEYVDRKSTWLDLKILVLTIPAVITGRGAY